jgi:inosine-uridine nucleoside N-ribohydrolase
MQRRQFISSTLALGALSLSGQVWAAKPKPALKPKPVIFHTDIGYDVDDTWALLLMLRRPELDLKLVVTEGENGAYRARLTAKLLELAGRTDIPIIYGPDSKNDPAPQSKWVGNYDLKSCPLAQRGDRAQAMIDLIMASKEMVTIICVGPATTTAEALRREPKIAARARFVGMQGSVRIGYDAKPSPDVEYNVKLDPVSLREVFAAPWKCTITPLDTCGQVTFDGALYQTLRHSKDPFAQAVKANTDVWFPNAPWMVPMIARGFDISQTSSTQFDSVAVMMAAGTNELIYETLALWVDDEGYTRIDPKKGRPVRVATKWRDMEAFKRQVVADLTRKA